MDLLWFVVWSCSKNGSLVFHSVDRKNQTRTIWVSLCRILLHLSVNLSKMPFSLNRVKSRVTRIHIPWRLSKYSVPVNDVVAMHVG